MMIFINNLYLRQSMKKNTPYRIVEYLYINIHTSPKMREVLYCLQMIYLHIY